MSCLQRYIKYEEKKCFCLKKTASIGKKLPPIGKGVSNGRKGCFQTLEVMLLMGGSYGGDYSTKRASASVWSFSMVSALTVDSTVTMGSTMVICFMASMASRIFLPATGAHEPFSMMATRRFW